MSPILLMRPVSRQILKTTLKAAPKIMPKCKLPSGSHGPPSGVAVCPWYGSPCIQSNPRLTVGVFPG